MITLPGELLVRVWSFLTPEEATRAGRTCRRLHGVAQDDALWRLFFPTRYPYTEVPQTGCKAAFLAQQSRLRLLKAPYTLAEPIHTLSQNEKIIWRASSSFLTFDRTAKQGTLYSYETKVPLLRFPLVSASNVAFSLASGHLAVREGDKLAVMSLATKNCIFAESGCNSYPILLTKEFLVYFKEGHVVVRRLTAIDKECLKLPMSWVPGLLSLNENQLTVTAKKGEHLVSIDIKAKTITPHHFPGYDFDHISPHYLIMHDKNSQPQVRDLSTFNFTYDIPLPTNGSWEAKIVAPDRLQIKCKTTKCDFLALHDIPNKRQLYKGEGPAMRYSNQQGEFLLFAFGEKDSQILRLLDGRTWEIPNTKGYIEAVNADGSLSVAKVQTAIGFIVHRCRPQDIPVPTRYLLKGRA